MARQSHPSQLIVAPKFDDGGLLADETDADCHFGLAKRVISDVCGEIRIELARSCPCLCSWKLPALMASIAGCVAIFDIGVAVLGQKFIGVPFIDVFISLAVFESGSALIAGVIFWAWMLTKHETRRSRGLSGPSVDMFESVEQSRPLIANELFVSSASSVWGNPKITPSQLV